MWGPAPWDNDAAADWFGNLMDKTKLAITVRKTLTNALKKTEWDEETAIVRAAACVILKLGHVYVWPIDHLKNDLVLAIQCLQKVLADEDYIYDDEIKTTVNKEIAELKLRFNQIN